MYYAVKIGRNPGIYQSWDDCRKEVNGYKGANFKKFSSLEEAEKFIGIKKNSTNNNYDVENRNEKDKIVLSDGNLLNMNDFRRMYRSKKVFSKNKEYPKEAVGELAIAYVDGSYVCAEKKYGYGVLFLHNYIETSIHGYGDEKELITMRNIAGEIKSAIIAMEIAVLRKINNLIIYHDYNGIEYFATGEWKAKNSYLKAYRKYVESISDLIHLDFIKVDAHKGVYYNEIADTLAKQGISSS